MIVLSANQPKSMDLSLVVIPWKISTNELIGCFAKGVIVTLLIYNRFPAETGGMKGR